MYNLVPQWGCADRAYSTYKQPWLLRVLNHIPTKSHKVFPTHAISAPISKYFASLLLVKILFGFKGNITQWKWTFKGKNNTQKQVNLNKAKQTHVEIKSTKRRNNLQPSNSHSAYGPWGPGFLTLLGIQDVFFTHFSPEQLYIMKELAAVVE